MEISPIKTRSARKRKEELVLLSVESLLPFTSDSRVLRGMKSLARAKP
jgi:hypothetical protein